MKIGTYNLKFLFDVGTRLHSGKECVFTEEFVEKRFRHFAKQFDLFDADILFLQELGDESALQKVIAQTAHEYSYFIAEPDRYGVGNAVVYKKEYICSCISVPTNASLPVFSEEDEDVLGPKKWSRRDYVRLETQWGGELLVLLGVHVKSNFLMYKEGASFPESPETLTQIDAADAVIRSEMFRLSQTKKIRELVDEVFAKSGDARIAVLGDFNTTSSSTMLRIALGRMNNRSDVLVDFVDSKTVDHVVVSKQLEKVIVNTKVYEDEVALDDPNSIGSDHAAILVELS